MDNHEAIMPPINKHKSQSALKRDQQRSIERDKTRRGFKTVISNPPASNIVSQARNNSENSKQVVICKRKTNPPEIDTSDNDINSHNVNKKSNRTEIHHSTTQNKNVDTSAHVDDTKGPVSSPVKNLSACKSQAISKGCYQKFIPDIQQSEMHILALTNDNIIVDYNADSGVVDLIYHRNSLYDKLLQLILEAIRAR